MARVSRMPRPSIMASSTPPNAADLAAERAPADRGGDCQHDLLQCCDTHMARRRCSPLAHMRVRGLCLCNSLPCHTGLMSMLGQDIRRPAGLGAKTQPAFL